MKEMFKLMVFVFLSTNIYAQISDDLGINSQWVDASITLKNGESFERQIQHNQFTGNIIFQNADGENISMQENRILSMEYSDPTTGQYRIFYSFEYREKGTGREQEMLFEIIKDFKGFAVLSKYLPATALGNTSDNDEIDVFASRSHGNVYGQAEIILFVGAEADLELYIVLAYIKKDGFLFDQTKYKVKIVDKKLPKKYLAEYWDQVKVFMDENRFDLRSKRELLQVLDYYESLVEN